MPVSSLLIRTVPGRRDEAAAALRALPGVDVTDELDDQLVVVTDTASRAEEEALEEAIHKAPGVLAKALIYHNFEDVEEETPWVRA